MRTLGKAALAATFVIAMSGCSTAGPSSGTGDETVSYCDAVANLQEVVAQKDTFTDATPAAEVKQWSKDVSRAVDQVVAAGRDLSQANTNVLSDAFDDVRSTVEDSLSDASNLGEVKAALSSGTDALEQAVTAASQAYDCGSTPSPS